MVTTAVDTTARTDTGTRTSAQTRLRWELLWNMVRKDLKIKYKDSVLGFAWSMANPLLLLAVYYFVFGVVLPTRMPYFTVYLMAGLLPWNMFATSALFAVGSVVGNAALVRKVRFPLGVLPLSSVGFALVHFGLQMAVFLVVLLGFGYPFIGVQLVLLVPAMIVLLVFTVALCTLVSALNVRYRDVQHMLEVGLTAWFWVNPIVYAAGLVARHLTHISWLYRVYFLNPTAAVGAAFQRAIYVHTYYVQAGQRQMALAAPGYRFYLEQLGACLVGSLLLLAVARWVFRRMQGDFAEEL